MPTFLSFNLNKRHGENNNKNENIKGCVEHLTNIDSVPYVVIELNLQQLVSKTWAKFNLTTTISHYIS